MYTPPCTPTAAVKDTHAHAAVKDTHAHGDTRMATGELAACGVVSICCVAILVSHCHHHHHIVVVVLYLLMFCFFDVYVYVCSGCIMILTGRVEV
jgi:small neutral amino acid transporter SnatA (MarC family)